MKAISLLQPHATLVSIRKKRIETRSWATSYRGLVVIHASKGFPRLCQELCYEDPFFDALQAGPGKLARGAVTAVARLFSICPTERVAFDLTDPEQAAEKAFGNYTAGRYAWFLNGVRALQTPIPCKGMLGLWTVPVDVEAEIVRQLGEAA